jgi:hypothetical protein
MLSASQITSAVFGKGKMGDGLMVTVEMGKGMLLVLSCFSKFISLYWKQFMFVTFATLQCAQK